MFLYLFTSTSLKALTIDASVGSGVVALPGTKDHTCCVKWTRAAYYRDKVTETHAHYLCTLHHSLLIPNLGLDYTTVIYTSMKSKGNTVAIRLHFVPTLYPVTHNLRC